MIWSIRTKWFGSISMNRGRIGGTLTRANLVSPDSGSRSPTAIDRLRVEM